MQRVTDPTTLPDIQQRVKNLNIQFKADPSNGILIPEYTGNLSTKYVSEYKPSEL